MNIKRLSFEVFIVWIRLWGADLRDLAVTKDSRSGLSMHSMKGTMTIPHLPRLVWSN